MNREHEPVLQGPVFKKIAWRLVPLMMLMYFVSSLDRANIGYAALTMNADLGLTVAQFGFATSIFYLGYILFETPANIILHKIGARLWISIILLAWGAMSSLTAFVPDKDWLYVTRFFLGVAESGLFPGMVLYLTLWLPSRNRVWVMSLFITAMPLAAVIGAPISTALMTHTGIFGLEGWRSMLFLEGLPAIALAFVVFRLLPDTPAKAGWMNASDVAAVQSVLKAESACRDQSIPEGSIRAALSSWRVWALGFVYFAINTAIVILLYFLPLVIKSFEQAFQTHYTVFEIGKITAIPFGFAVVCMLLWARFTGRAGIVAWHIALPLVICAVAIGMAMSLPSPLQIMSAFAVGCAACFSSMAPFWQLPSRLLSGKAAAAGIGLIAALGASSGFVLPYIIGWVKDKTGSFEPAFMGVGVIMLAGAITVLLLEKRRASKVFDQVPAKP
ncbi:MFS transporter [Pseudomonas putida]|uniref:MFS transporter n=1 Tax=Pseudomonas putida TaxID=303 RepID=UPI00300EA1C7